MPLAALALALALAAKPVAKTYRGPLDAVDVREQSAAVIARFAAPDRAAAEAALSEVGKATGQTADMTVAFVRTDAGALAAVSLSTPGTHLPFARYSDFARRLSARPGVATAWATVAPGPRDDSLEQEATFRFERGEPAGEARAQYRDDPVYLEHVRRKSTASAFHRARWPDYPLSKLAAELQLPGRSCLDAPWQLQTLSTTRWPIDAGDDLALAWVDVPGGVATEVQQEAIKQRRSMSALVADALHAAREAKALAEPPEGAGHAGYDEGQPDAEKQARRTLTLFLPEEELDAAEDKGAAQAISISRVIGYAWRRAHPVETKR